MKRRTFLQQTSAAASASYLGIPLIKSQKDSYRIVLIGSGWWGMNILREAVRSGKVKLVGLCDVDQSQLKKAADEVKEWNGESPKWYTDYRQCIEDAQPEIAIVATPDHWHALPTIAAINAGAHVYVEKPISHTVLEGAAMLKAARTNERVVQVGTHRRASPHMIAGMDFLKSGKVGKVTSAKCFVNRSGNPGEPTPDSEAPAGLDWDMWVGPAPMQPFNEKIHPKGFRQFLDFANGTIGDWGIHWFDQVLWWTEEKFPTSVFSTGGRYMKQDNTDAPDTQLAAFDFEEFTCFWEHKLMAANANEQHDIGCYFYGTEGTLHLGWRDGWSFYPSKKSGQEIHMDPDVNEPDFQNIKELWADFMDSIENKKRPMCDIENGYHATNMSLLAMISMKLGRSVQWDGHQVINDSEATALLQRPYRAPWIYPS
ncbi:MAG: Gfo/Idh/MocA family oxidoreductase [Saprospiraceae bacterium]|nr:Gfo/Idh/MocA family oxidoreductase [Saprospiraceae bacterium]